MMPLSRRAVDVARPAPTPAGRVLVLNVDVFRTAIDRECKRADRFNQKMALVLVSAAPGCGALDVTRVTESISIVKRPTDIVGWVRSGVILGIIVPEISESEGPIADTLRDRVRRGLDTQYGAGDTFRPTIRIRLYPGPWNVAAKDATSDTVDVDDERTVTSTVGRLLYRPLKRGCDIAGSLAGLLLLLPVFVVAAATVKLSSRGPILFRQARVGHRQRPFMMLKFRTMHVDADPELHQRYMASFIGGLPGESATGTGDARFKLVNDPRVTRVGAVLRKTSIDELPQLWNVLRGEMSLVGPRPPIHYEVQQYEPWHWRRVMDVKPGMTGLWQVAGRSCTTFDEMVRLDLRYAKTCSLWTDLKILLATPAAVVSGKGAR